MKLLPGVGTQTQRVFVVIMALVMALLASTAVAQDTSANNTQKEASDAQQQPAPKAQEAGPQPATADEKKPEAAAAEKADNSGSAPVKPPFKIEKNNLSYALGVDTARGLKAQGIDIDLDLLIKGLKEGYGGEKLTVMSEHELLVTLKVFGDMQKRQFDQALKLTADKNKKAGEEFFADNAKKQEVVTLPSGLQYRIVKQGDGKKPTLADKVVCHYRAMLLDGTAFDDSYKRKRPVTFPVKGVIKGWREALQLMPVGSKWELFIPPQLAYGEQGTSGVIGPNATLKFELELISIESKPEADGKPQPSGGKGL